MAENVIRANSDACEVYDIIDSDSLNSDSEDNDSVYSRSRSGSSSDDLIPRSIDSKRTMKSNSEPLEGYTYEFVPKVESDKYECPICMQILRDPYQTKCGHRFCEFCIKRWIRQNPICPVDNEDLKKPGAISTDNAVKREIRCMVVRCPNTKNGCREQKELKDMETHEIGCEYRRVKCPSNCGESPIKNELQQHLILNCTKRLVACKNCNATFAIDQSEEHLAACPSAIIQCEYCGEMIQRIKHSEHCINICPNIQLHCQFAQFGCTAVMKRNEIADHMNNAMADHLNFLCGAVYNMQLQPHPVMLQKEVNGKVDSVSGMNDYFDQNANEKIDSKIDKLGSLTEEERECATNKGFSIFRNGSLDSNTKFASEKKISHIESRMQDHDVNLAMSKQIALEMSSKIENLESKVVEQSKTINQLEEKLTGLELKFCDGLFLWKIRNFSQIVAETVQGETKVMHSPGFYTSQNGYKLCLRMNMNMNQQKGRFLSLYVHFMQGENDEILEWPFIGEIELTILDQNENLNLRKNITETFVTKPTLAAFQKPLIPRNHRGFGYTEFVALNVLQNGYYLKNETLFIRAIVQSKKDR